MKNTIKIFLVMVLLVLFTSTVSANINVEGISFDPAIIAAGDEVDITVNFRELVSPGSSSNTEANEPEYS
ncbi:TPA: hypothetical protein HA369_00205, partial [Candidatus Woesearchaeota archaeon]|nr:hypothetical protein [Candidatus Woesearchaeota archaeon]